MTILTDPRHCLSYDNLPAGQSAQRQPCGRAGAAPPTRGQENTLLEPVCAGRRPCDDPRFTFPGVLKMKVIGKKFQDVDRFALTFLVIKDGDLSTRGSILIGNPTHPGVPTGREVLIWGPIRREVKADVPTRIKIPITTRFKGSVKRALRRGKLVRAFVTSVGRDKELLPAAVPLEPRVRTYELAAERVGSTRCANRCSKPVRPGQCGADVADPAADRTHPVRFTLGQHGGRRRPVAAVREGSERRVAASPGSPLAARGGRPASMTASRSDRLGEVGGASRRGRAPRHRPAKPAL